MLELNKIYNMDCLEGLAQMEDSSIDLVVTDPPYKFENKGGGFYAHNKTTQRVYLDSLGKIDCTTFEPLPLLNILKAKMKKFYGYFFCNKTLIDAYIRFAKENRYSFDLLVMAKSNPIPAFNNHHLSDLEYIVMMRDKGTYFSKHKDVNDFRKFYLTSCKKGIHPAEKPIALIERFIRISSKEGDVVLDPFMGSGTTAVACKSLKRNYIGFELDSKYHKIAQQRVKSQPGWLDKLLESEEN